MKSFGFWAHTPLSLRPGAERTGEGHPPVEDYVCSSWEGREEALRLLEQGTELASYTGNALCRLCGVDVGHADMTLDGTAMWPESLSHYVREHGVKLPDWFLEHLREGGDKRVVAIRQRHHQVMLREHMLMQEVKRKSLEEATCSLAGGCLGTCTPKGYTNGMTCKVGNSSSYLCQGAFDPSCKRLEESRMLMERELEDL